MPPRPDIERVFNRLKVLRVDRGLSRQDLAAALGVHYQTVGYLERSEYSPSLALALRIAEYLRLPVESIFSLTPLPPLSTQVDGVIGAAGRRPDLISEESS